MNSRDLSIEQLRRVAADAKLHRDYFARLRDRMRSLRFPKDDELLTAVLRACEGASHVAVHAASMANAREKRGGAPAGDVKP